MFGYNLTASVIKSLVIEIYKLLSSVAIPSDSLKRLTSSSSKFTIITFPSSLSVLPLVISTASAFSDGSLTNVMASAMSEEASTVSLNDSVSILLVRFSVNDNSCGGVVSCMNVTAGLALFVGIGITGCPAISEMKSFVNEIQQLFISEQRLGSC